MSSSQPRIAIIGGGMAGMAAATTLINYRDFVESGRLKFKPQITIYEAEAYLGGKTVGGMRDANGALFPNQGAQFLDEFDFYPVSKYVEKFKIPLLPPRGDYDEAPFYFDDGSVLSGSDFAKAVATLRQESKVLLESMPMHALDQMTACQVIDLIAKHRDLTPPQTLAMKYRLFTEEATDKISGLAFCILQAKSRTPNRRFEVDGGIPTIIGAMQSSLLRKGAEFLIDTVVNRIEVMSEGVRVFSTHDYVPTVNTFDEVIVAISPEHYKYITFDPAQKVARTMSKLKPANISKTNIVFKSNATPLGEEHSTPRYSFWFSQMKNSGQTMATFFHGYSPDAVLTDEEMLKILFKGNVPSDLEGLSMVTRHWNGDQKPGALQHHYTSMIDVGEAQEVVENAQEYLFSLFKKLKNRLWLGCHAAVVGCYVRDAAHFGERAGLAIIKKRGFRIRPEFIESEAILESIFGVVPKDFREKREVKNNKSKKTRSRSKQVVKNGIANQPEKGGAHRYNAHLSKSRGTIAVKFRGEQRALKHGAKGSR